MLGEVDRLLGVRHVQTTGFVKDDLVSGLFFGCIPVMRAAIVMRYVATREFGVCYRSAHRSLAGCGSCRLQPGDAASAGRFVFVGDRKRLAAAVTAKDIGPCIL